MFFLPSNTKEETRPDPEALSTNIQKPLIRMKLLNCGAVVITSAQVHSTKPELFLAGSNPGSDVSEIRDGEDL